jgi:succinyl-diaminopimelate desuccinylase
MTNSLLERLMNRQVPNSIAQLTADIVRFPSLSSDVVVCRELLEHVASLFDGHGYVLRWFESNGVPSLIVSRRPVFNFSLIFLGHIDVVPGPSEIFEPRFDGDRLYGRGSADMKGSVAAMISLFLNYSRSSLFEDAALVLTGDEEVGGSNGAGYLVESLGMRADVAIVPDGGAALTPCIFEKGIQHVRMSVTGKAAHGSRPWLGESAVDLLLDDLQALRNVFQRACANNQWDLSLNIGRIEGGKAGNLVADAAEALLDFRFCSRRKVSEIQEAISKTVRHCAVEYVAHGEAVCVDEHRSEYRLFVEALERFGGSGMGIREHGTSDARWFMNYGTVMLITMPLCSAFHVVDEWVSVESLDRLYGAFEAFSVRYLQNKEHLDPVPKSATNYWTLQDGV